MSITIAKWMIDQYHELVNTGILTDRRVELLLGDIIEMSPELIIFRGANTTGYETETRLSIGNIKPLSFPDIEIDVRRLFS